MSPLTSNSLLEIRGGSMTPTAWLYIPDVPTDPFLSLLFESWPTPSNAIGDDIGN